MKLPFTKSEWDQMKKEQHGEMLDAIFSPAAVIVILFILLMITVLLYEKERYNNLPQDQKDYEDFMREQN